MNQTNPQDQQRFAPPRARVADVPSSSGSLEMAERSTRFWAAMIDMVLLMVVFGLLLVVLPESFLNMERGYWSFDVIESLLGFVLFMAINGHLLRTQGQTVGKMLLKIRVVRTDGSRASLMTLAGVRYGVGYLLNVVLAVGMIYGLIDSLSIFRDSRRCIHDLIADTMVVKA